MLLKLPKIFMADGQRVSKERVEAISASLLALEASAFAARLMHNKKSRPASLMQLAKELAADPRVKLSGYNLFALRENRLVDVYMEMPEDIRAVILVQEKHKNVWKDGFHNFMTRKKNVRALKRALKGVNFVDMMMADFAASKRAGSHVASANRGQYCDLAELQAWRSEPYPRVSKTLCRDWVRSLKFSGLGT